MEIKLFIDNQFNKEEVEKIIEDIKMIDNNKQLSEYLNNHFKWLLYDEPASIYLFKKDKHFIDIGDINISK